MAIKAGDLNQIVILRRRVETQDEYGTLVPTVLTLATVKANVRPMSGRERDYAQQTQSRANFVITIRTRYDVTESDYVVWRGEEFNVRFVKSEPRSRFMELECERGAA